jgi:glycerol-3-phosphate dehydrogenase
MVVRASPMIIGKSSAKDILSLKERRVISQLSSGPRPQEFLDLAAGNPDLLQTILRGGHAIRAEAFYAVRYEMAATIEDVLTRRLGMQFYSWSDCIDAAPVVGALIAEELNWTRSYMYEAISD